MNTKIETKIGASYNVKGFGVAKLVSAAKGWYTLTNKEGKTTKCRLDKLTPATSNAAVDSGERKGPRFRDPKTGRVVYFGKLVRHPDLVTESGAIPLDNNDEAADLLRGKQSEEQYKIVAALLAQVSGVSKREALQALKDKYGKLNLGQQRMVLGNRLRGLFNMKAAEDSEVSTDE